jgi:hypothetical protein
MSWRDHDTANSHWVASSDEPGLHLHLRAHGDEPSRPPVLMVHGATYASRLYDIPYPGASWLRATAEAGFPSSAIRTLCVTDADGRYQGQLTFGDGAANACSEPKADISV